MRCHQGTLQELTIGTPDGCNCQTPAYNGVDVSHSVSSAHFRETFLGFQKPEAELRSAYIRVSLTSPTAARPVQADRDMVRRSAHFLELVAVSACTVEALIESPPGDHPGPAYFAQLASRVQQVSGLDPAEATREAIDALGAPSADVELAQPPELHAIIRPIRSFVEAVPIELLEQFGHTYHVQEWSFRCRVAFDAIWAFLFRNDTKERSRLTTVGIAYASGKIAIDAAASLLGVGPSEAIAVLETAGFRRTIDVIRLSPTERTERLAGIRRDRHERAGMPRPSDAAIARDVVASQRIEGIDARRWVPDGR